MQSETNVLVGGVSVRFLISKTYDLAFSFNNPFSLPNIFPMKCLFEPDSSQAALLGIHFCKYRLHNHFQPQMDVHFHKGPI